MHTICWLKRDYVDGKLTDGKDYDKMKLRKINIKRLAWSGIIYRLFIILCNSLFFLLGVEYLLEQYGAIVSALIWNAINMMLYYLYHYWFLRFFKMEKVNKLDNNKK